MFDENGERYRRRVFDGWKILPLTVGPALGLLAWGISVETRLSAITVTQIERGPQIAKMREDMDDMKIRVYDPSTKPETKKEISQLWSDLDKMGARIDRIEERFNNFHQFLIQTRPNAVPLGRRGDGPFKPEVEGKDG